MQLSYLTPIFTVAVILFSGLFVSCEKESFVEKPASVQHQTNTENGQGSIAFKGLEDEMIIIGIVQKDNGQTLVSNAEVKFIDTNSYEEVTSVTTGANGDFTAQVPAGNYVAEVYSGGNYVGASNETTVESNMSMTIDL